MQANWQEVFVLLTQTLASTSQHTNKHDGLPRSPDARLPITLHVPPSVLLIDKKGLFLNTELDSAGVSVAFAHPAVGEQRVSPLVVIVNTTQSIIMSFSFRVTCLTQWL